MIRKKRGESVYALQISEALTSVRDRAVARAVALRSKRHQPAVDLREGDFAKK